MKKLVMNDSTALFLYAMQFYGVKEKIGQEHNPLILEWFHQIGHTWVSNDETPYCSAFMAYIAKEMGLEYSTDLLARSWLNYGIPKGFPVVQLGHVVVLWRGSLNSKFGHVGLYAGQDLHKVYLLGGNQDNMVCIKAYSKKTVLGVRELRRIKYV